MASYNPAIPCCCGSSEVGKKLCCISLTADWSCATLVPDPENCAMIPGDPETLTMSTRVKYCVNTEAECTCDLLDDENAERPGYGGLGEGGFGTDVGAFEPVVIECSAAFVDISCYYGSTEEPEDDPCRKIQAVCDKFTCGPCGPTISGCTVVEVGNPCPPVPDCGEPAACCGPPPPGDLCCVRVLVDGCIASTSCEPCGDFGDSGTGDTNSGVVSRRIDNCDDCDPDSAVWIASACCASCGGDLQDCAGPVINDCCCPIPGIGVSCAECLGGAPCVTGACIKPCEQGGSAPSLPLCPCPIRDFGWTCLAALSDPNNGTVSNFAEGDYFKGLIRDKIADTYKVNTLLLFGYGYEQL